MYVLSSLAIANHHQSLLVWHFHTYGRLPFSPQASCALVMLSLTGIPNRLWNRISRQRIRTLPIGFSPIQVSLSEFGAESSLRKSRWFLASGTLDSRNSILPRFARWAHRADHNGSKSLACKCLKNNGRGERI
jgi:hypothetical protein